MDTEGSEVHISDLPAPIKADKSAEFVFTVRDPASCGPNCFAVRCGTTGERARVLHGCCACMPCAEGEAGSSGMQEHVASCQGACGAVWRPLI